MPSVKRWRGLLGLCVAALSSMAFAFTPASAPLLSSTAVPPNVMLLVDNSGSMNNAIWATGFDQTVARSQVYNCYAGFGCNSTNNTIALDMTSDNIILGNLYQGNCRNNYVAFYRSATRDTLCLRLPDPVGNTNTRYSAKYLAYLIGLVASGTTTKDYTDGSIPNDYRINVARTVSVALIAANRTMRFGLASYNPPSGNDSGPGGNITRAMADLSATSNTTTAQANANYTSLVAAINGLGAIANTPLAETYYEITRYMRGMSSYYNSGVTYTSPIQYRCQKNYGIVITDGLPTYDRTFPTAIGSVEPYNSATQSLPNWDNVNNDGNNLNGDGEGDTLYLDDIAKFAYDIDMRSSGNDAAGKSWSSPDFPKQNMLTYTVGFTAVAQMLSDAAAYGQGKYYQTSDAASLTTALTNALNAISAASGSGGGGAASTSTLTSNTTYYQTTYNPADWRGTIAAYALSTAGVLASTATWSTDTTMAVGTTTPLYESFNTTTNKPITLSLANFSTTQQGTLTTTAAQMTQANSASPAITATNLLNWSQGTNTTGLRTRAVLLGDIIGSPLVLASPTVQTATDLTTDSTYSTYLSTKAQSMTPTLVVNSNDGLTSVINATTGTAGGTRLYAYMPSTVLPYIYQIADPAYINGTSHRFLDDGQIAIYDAQLGGSWKTLALGGTGAGGRAFYALQLFDATQGNSVKALWEISAPTTANTANTFNDLGYAYAKPEVAKLPDGTWAAFISNGYGSNSGVAALYIVSLADGSLIKKIVVDSTETTNGLSSVKLTVNSSNVVQAAYGGDLKGRMWKFDLSSTSTASWGLAYSGKPLFTAPGGATQAITAQPLVVANQSTGYMVYFGTGKFNETADRTTTDPQGFYAVWDQGTAGTGNYTTANLQAQSVTGTYAATGGTYVTSTSNTVNYTSQKGFYLPLVYGTTLVGHRVIYQAAYKLGRIIFTTAYVDTSDPCATQGTGYIFELDGLSGSMLTYPVIDNNGDNLVDSKDTVTSGLLIATGIPVLNAIVDDTGGSNTSLKLINDSSSTITKIREKGSATSGSGRIMWRQIQ